MDGRLTLHLVTTHNSATILLLRIRSKRRQNWCAFSSSVKPLKALQTVDCCESKCGEILQKNSVKPNFSRNRPVPVTRQFIRFSDCVESALVPSLVPDDDYSRRYAVKSKTLYLVIQGFFSSLESSRRSDLISKFSGILNTENGLYCHTSRMRSRYCEEASVFSHSFVKFGVSERIGQNSRKPSRRPPLQFVYVLIMQPLARRPWQLPLLAGSCWCC